MTGFSDEVENDLLDLVINGVAYVKGPATLVSLHSADPGETGANELINIGGTLYTRKSCTGLWTTPTVGEVVLTTDIKWSWLPGGPITHYGLWNASGDFLGSGTSGITESLQLYDGFWLEAGTVFRLD